MSDEPKLTGRQRRARQEAERRLKDGLGLGVCGAIKTDGSTCVLAAGQYTTHEGTGRCAAHGGNSVRENAIAAWMMGSQFAGELNVTPWDALLTVLRRAAQKAQWYQTELLRVSESCDDADLLPGGAYFSLVREAERADTVLAKTAKLTLDAGVAERLVSSITAQATVIAQVLNAALDEDALGLSPEQARIARSLMRRELLRIEATERGEVIEGNVTSGNGDVDKI